MTSLMSQGWKDQGQITNDVSNLEVLLFPLIYMSDTFRN